MMFLEEQVQEEKEKTEQGQGKAAMVKSTGGHSCQTSVTYPLRHCSARAHRGEGQHLTIAVTCLSDLRLPLSEAPEAFCQ